MKDSRICFTSATISHASARCGCVHYIFHSQLCNNFSNFILSLVTKRGRTCIILDKVQSAYFSAMSFLLKLLTWSEMVRNVMESDFLVILSTILWTKMAGQPFLTQKYPMVVIYFFKLYWFEMARNALKSDFRSSKRGKPLMYIALGNGFASGLCGLTPFHFLDQEQENILYSWKTPVISF